MEPLGMSQVWQYLKALSKVHTIHIISFEKPDDLLNKGKLDALSAEVESCGVSWCRLKYHKSPNVIATAYDILCGIGLSIFFIKKLKIDIIHARSYVSASIAIFISKLLNIKFIFDMRGFWADEKIDGKTWKKESLIYKLTKKLESSFISKSTYIVSLTNAGRDDIISLYPIKGISEKVVVIPTCVNLKIFHPQLSRRIFNVDDKDYIFTLGYVGSVGTFYLFDEVLKSFEVLLKIRKNSKLLIVNKGQHDFIYKKILEFGFNKKQVKIKSASYIDVAININMMDAGIFYIMPSFSKRSSSPTKFGEFLGCGKPCISNYGVGDTESILSNEGVGIVLKGFSDSDHLDGIEGLLKLVSDSGAMKKCIDVATKHYSIDVGVEKYSHIYNQITYKK